jgi:pSer/pThr/pTyr-binding forkhead associated (FHA) protein
VSDQVLSILKLCLVAVLYLFFLRVLWAVATEVRAPELTAATRPRRKKKSRSAKSSPAESLVIVAPAEIAGRAYPLANELTIGRAVGCHISLDDTFVSQLHARVFRVDGVVHVEDLGSTNGTLLNDAPVSSPAIVRKGDRLRIGSIVMELRT